MDSVTDLLQQLVRIPSVNPDGDPGTDQCGEEAIAAWLGDFLSDRGFAVTTEDVEPGRPNLLARSPGPPSDSRPRILLGPHLDTVGVGGMTIDPFGGEVRDGKLWGRGASDTKGPMAAMLWGLLRNRERLADLSVAVDFVAFMSEESDQFGSKHFARNHAADYAFAVAGEPTGLDLVHTTKGSLWAVLESSGVSGHSSQPESGENAIMKMVHALSILESDLKPDLAGFTHPVLGPATINVGIVRGGTRANIIPDEATAQIDIRYPPSLAEERSATELLKEFLARNNLPVTLSVSADNPPMEVPADHPWLRRILAIHPQSRLVGAPWFSDAAHLNKGGLPAICLGPGSIEQAHTRDEFITLADLEAGADYFTALIAGLKSS
ncbi:MAG: M20 family metallopeptidase [Roseibacillus sp.]|nr:M20 family metallopeptidase [Roseibacillus sp.]